MEKVEDIMRKYERLSSKNRKAFRAYLDSLPPMQ